ncbi:uncharacterized protein LOC129597980 [Paramacrobiotus metropolitanus]|uniref:uncharacterized protein LOC129597980 n=1 Tax=Paramacrobiotus metropolitanus TaxID=2943436 RepID=UPI0024456D58|nr:uncharacterized protein LOC129597980 [Paramacrobiotus metropolitanus]
MKVLKCILALCSYSVVCNRCQGLTIQATSGLRLPSPSSRHMPMLKKQSLQNLIFLVRMAPFPKVARRHSRRDPALESSMEERPDSQTQSPMVVLANWDRFKASVQARWQSSGKDKESTTTESSHVPLLNGLAIPKLFFIGGNRVAYMPQSATHHPRVPTKFPFKKYRGR